MNRDASMEDLRENLCSRPELRYVIFILSLQWKNETAMLKKRLEAEGIVCMDLSVGRNALRLDGADKLEILSGLLDELFTGVGDWKKETVFLSDSSEIGRTLAQLGLVYFGCIEEIDAPSIERNAAHLEGALNAPSMEENADGADTWFEGAALVLEGFADIDARYLREWLLRAQGLPALIAKTERLLMREIAEEDIPELVRISRQDGQTALAAEWVETEVEEKSGTSSLCAWDVFSEDRLHAYIQSAYQLQGYGLWSVLYQGKVIGCCGFAPWNGAVKRNASRLDVAVEMSPCLPARDILYEVWDAYDLEERNDCANDVEVEMISLEMQYMLDISFRRRGFGTEMCRTALEYAHTRLDVEEVWVRIHEDNYASQALAEKLGFHRCC